MRKVIGILCLSTQLILALALPSLAKATTYQSNWVRFQVEVLNSSLDYPWSMVFLPDDSILVSERRGQLLHISAAGDKIMRVSGLPAVDAFGQGGLLGLALHPDFKSNRRVYFSYVSGSRFTGASTQVAYGELVGDQLQNVTNIFNVQPSVSGGKHFGGRLLFDNEQRLYIGLGERGDRERAQDKMDHNGSLLRLTDDGAPAPVSLPISPDKPEIFSIGHRNIQGLAKHPETGEIWSHEHGPQGGDELNKAKGSANFGWPEITYGVNYVIGTSIGVGTHLKGMEQPIYYWDPSIAPSGMTFYDGDMFPEWRGNLFVGSLKFELLVRLEMEADRVVAEERLFEGEFGRIRDVQQGPDGALYVLTDESPGKLLRISRASN